MKKVILYIFSVALFVPYLAIAQEEQDSKFYVKVQGGYNFARKKASLYNYFTTEIGLNSQLHVFDGVDSAKAKFTNISYGKGGKFDISGGYMFSKYFGFELAVGYQWSPEYKTLMEFPKQGQVWRFNSNFKTFTLTPTFVLSPGISKINPYAKMGLEIGLDARISNKHERINNSNKVISRQKETLEGTSFGFSTSLGVAIDFSNTLSMFLEFNRTDMDFRPHTRKVSEFNNLGVNMMEIFYGKKGDIEIELEDKYAEASTKVVRTYSVNSFGINAGLMFKF